MIYDAVFCDQLLHDSQYKIVRLKGKDCKTLQPSTSRSLVKPFKIFACLLSTMMLSSILTPNFPSIYIPGSIVMAIFLLNICRFGFLSHGGSWILRPTPCPAEWVKWFPYPRLLIDALHSSSTRSHKIPSLAYSIPIC